MEVLLVPRHLSPFTTACVDDPATTLRLHAITETTLVALDVALSDSRMHDSSPLAP